jgi:Leucine-rich repeat (LRR) protein
LIEGVVLNMEQAAKQDNAVAGDAATLKQSTDVFLCLQSHELCEIPSEVLTLSSLQKLDLSRNKLGSLPPAISSLVSLTHLNISRNNIRAIPSELGQLYQLLELNALSNQIRPTGLPLAELAAGLTALRVLDLQYNSKLKAAAHDSIATALPWVTDLRVTVKPKPPPPSETCGGGVVAGLRDPSSLQAQLEPISSK